MSTKEWLKLVEEYHSLLCAELAVPCADASSAHMKPALQDKASCSWLGLHHTIAESASKGIADAQMKCKT